MVEKFKLILKKIEEQKGKTRLFAILKMDDITDKWTVILSAPWTSEENHMEDFIFLRKLMIESFSKEEMATIARIGIFAKQDHIVEELLKYQEGSIINQDEKVNGNIVHEAFILASDVNI